jgi:hypothetical protein
MSKKYTLEHCTDSGVVNGEFARRLAEKQRREFGAMLETKPDVEGIVREHHTGIPRSSVPGGEHVESKTGRRLTYRSWLWLAQTKATEFAPLARLVLGGGPDGMWMNKPLRADQTFFDIQQMYASGRQGIRQEHVDLAERAVKAFLESGSTVENLIKTKNRDEASDGKMIATEAQKSSQAAADQLSGDELVKVGAYYGEGGIAKVECSHTNYYGRKCNKLAIPGSIRCELHGGRQIPPEELKEIVRKSYELILSTSTAAVETTLDIMQNSVDDKVRLKAAEMLLDRAGLRPGVDITVNGGNEDGDGIDPVNLVRERLAALAEHPVNQGKVITQDGDEVT